MKQQHIKHGGAYSRIYSIWRGMKARCYKKYSNRYYSHGDRGIKVCDEWLNDFITFRHWAYNNGYEENLSIDRIDNNKDYTPKNCRFTNNAIQQQNSRRLSKSNTSGYRGVAVLKDGRYTASLRSFGKYIHLGIFKNKIDAAKTRDSYIIVNSLEHTLNDIDCWSAL